MTPFLRQVATYYSSERNLQDYYFVFPNRRSGQFFEKELSEQFSTPHMMPKVLTMPEWLEEMSDRDIASTIDMVFLLYRAYCETLERDDSFDKFIYWAQVILSDFNDVDMAMANADHLFTNLKDLRGISSNHIDPALKNEINRILNIQITGGDSLWKNYPTPGDSTDSPMVKFITLWEKLAEIYHRFHALLDERGLITQGHLYRTMAERMSDMTIQDLGCQQVVMVGFTALTVSEDHIFKALKQMGAHFWWDDRSPAFDLEANQGGQLLRLFSKRYPSPEPLEELDKTANDQHIHVMAVPSGIGQAKWAFHLVEQMGLSPEQRAKDVQTLNLPKIDLSNAINTAIVLPDENLFVPLINSVPESVKRLNVTLGYPMRHSGVVSLMHIVARAHKQASFNRATNRWMFFREDVNDILSHPVVKSAFTADVVRIANAMEKSNDFNVPEDMFADTALQPLFTTIHTLESAAEVLAYIDRLIQFLETLDQRVRDRDAAENDNRLPLQSAFIVKYVDALQQLRRAIDASEYTLTRDTSIFFLIDRVTSAITVPFTGEPLEGLQLMGILEARCLDFENVIILSMNERVFPSYRPMSSFIPDFLRAFHLMPTNAWHEAVTTAHFYRLLSRARHALLIYDCSTGSSSAGEPSRYIKQLQMIYGRDVTPHIVDAQPDTPTELAIEVPKREDMLAHYTRPGSDNPLSVSAIKKYLRCPLLFYLRYVQHLNDDNTTSDFMDSLTVGSVIHNTLQTLYYPNGSGTHHVDAQTIRSFDHDYLRTALVREVNKTYFHRQTDELDKPLRGDAYILFETLETYVRNVLNYDLHLIETTGSDIEVLECEVEHVMPLSVGDINLNFTFTIDRLDRIGGMVRLIDYKTGKDKTSFSGVEQLLGKNHEFHALMQLMVYCHALHQLNPDFSTLQPMIYKLRDIEQSGMFLKKKQYIYTPDDGFNQQFLALLQTVLDEMLSIDGTFKQTDQAKTCVSCRFAEFCRKV